MIKRYIYFFRAIALGTRISDRSFYDALISLYSSKEKFIKHRNTKCIPILLDNSKKKIIIAALQNRYPEAEEKILFAANNVYQHTFDLLGSGSVFLGENINWHFDFIHDYSFSKEQYFTFIRPASFPGGYDIKVPWELSRCQQFVWLGQAYWFTGDEIYAEEFISQSLDWIEHNPPQFGVNWSSTMDVSIRAINWLWGYYLFLDSQKITDEFLWIFFKNLLIHGRHIFNNLEVFETEKGPLTSNHFLSNIVGLVYLGLLMPEFKESFKWRDFGLYTLEREIFEQTYPDGIDFEASTSYHRLATELFLSATVLALRNGHQFTDGYMDRLEKMLEFIMEITKPDGTVPLIGDVDNGRVHRLKIWSDPQREWIDYRYLLAIGAVLFNRTDFAQVAGDQWEEAIWLLGEKAIIYKDSIEIKHSSPFQLESRAFPSGGLYVLRQDDNYMAIDAGRNGQIGFGGHAHNDIFSFELFAGNRTWIVDPGTYLYTPDFAARNLFRSTAYHNTVKVNESEQNPFFEYNLFRMKQDANVNIIKWEDNPLYALLIAEHDGYVRPPYFVIHQRLIFFDKREELWLVRDALKCLSNRFPVCLATSFLHFSPGLQAEKSFGTWPGIRILAPDSRQFVLLLCSRSEQEVKIEIGWVSPSYGIRKEAYIASWSWLDVNEYILGLDVSIDERNIEHRVFNLRRKWKNVLDS